MATTKVKGVLENAVTYDGSGLKTFELLRKERKESGSQENILFFEENQEALQEWVNYHRYETDVTYTVTIDDESIETTAGHPFYTTDEGWKGADELATGDKVELADGSSGTVESVDRNEHDEPITIYNFNVMDYHMYYVSESEALVHNDGCGPKVDIEGGRKCRKYV